MILVLEHVNAIAVTIQIDGVFSRSPLKYIITEINLLEVSLISSVMIFNSC